MAMPVFKILDVYLMAMHSGPDPALGKHTVNNEYQPPLNSTIDDRNTKRPQIESDTIQLLEQERVSADVNGALCCCAQSLQEDIQANSETWRLTSLSSPTPGSSTGPCFHQETLNMFSGMGRSVWKEACATLQNILSAAEPVLPDNKALRNKCIVPMSDIEMVHPIIVGGYTDFFCSVRDGRNCGVYLLSVADSSQSKLYATKRNQGAWEARTSNATFGNEVPSV
ncbi:uncharacterized protein LOC120683565 isoform X1 [Panicum virgatum]|uniref:uncharacterized protein LOC120683565 isoform X1 n=2 Tax=Panicum virgatum TaxID=38727 RepID=UPI0019D6386B|nr:uncharacterized protein LOC120683565 isoform X1 [Panicum virgatum]